MSFAIKLSPAGLLQIEILEDDPQPQSMPSQIKAFQADWREGWFRLAAEKPSMNMEASMRFWQDVAAHYVLKLCHLPPEITDAHVENPEREQFEEWALRAPPMIGGEYLSTQILMQLWSALDGWVQETAKEHASIHDFLSEWAPLWQQVGCVCFHLAENKQNAERPFAFLATYSTGFTTGGKLKHLPLKEALSQYAGANNREGLVKLLTPVQKASERCPWVESLVHTAELYQPLAWPAQKAYRLLQSIPDLEACGLTVRIPNWWKKRPRPQVQVTIGETDRPTLGMESLLDFNIHISLGEQKLSEEELQEILASGQQLLNIRGQWIEVDRQKLQEALAHWKQVQKQHKNGQISFAEGMRLLAGAPSDLDAENDDADQSRWVRVIPGAAMADVLQNMRSPTIQSSAPLLHLQATLRPYQQEGINWMSLLSGLGMGACLADDMGLGKTLQVLALLLLKKNQLEERTVHPSLIVAPASLLRNWQKEAERFTPTLRLLLLHPSELKQSALEAAEKDPEAFFAGIDVVVTTYSMVTRMEWMTKHNWHIVVLDEAQAIKNHGTKQAKAVKKLPAVAKIALTGTPVENRLSDLWSLFDFLNPGLLGSPKRFKDYINSLQSAAGHYEPLRKLTAPYILRRMKTDPKIISDLPTKTETPAWCTLTKKQAQCYQSVVDELAKGIEQLSPEQRRGMVLKALMQLKQVCNHPAHFSGNGDYVPEHSGKFERLGEICEELADRQEKVLIFTQFAEIIPYLHSFMETLFHRKGLILHGGTSVKDRHGLVEQFQKSDGPPFFILSLKAGGTGLTLTEASHVIHFDRGWNPAVENQATDRAFRIGQKKCVQVHKFITVGTIEEKIDAIIESKKKLAHEIIGGTADAALTELPNDQLLQLLALDIDKTT
jgi:SNF2 family DNA or RNA helicase